MRIIFVLLALVSLSASAQSKVFCLQPSCSQTVNVGDSATIFAQLTASDGFGSIRWLQVSGPTATIPTSKLATVGTGSTQSAISLTPSTAGTYVFSIIGTSFTGSVATVSDTLFVNAAAKRIAYVMTVYTDSSRVKTQ